METNFKIEIYESNGNWLRANIISPAGRRASCGFVGGDGRLSRLRSQANIEFCSENLRLSENLIDQMIASFRKFSDDQKKVDPEFSLDNV